MMLAMIASALLVLATTVLHYEVLQALHHGLPRLRMANRAKLVVVILATFTAHAAEVALYGLAFWVLVTHMDQGHLMGSGELTLGNCLYFSAETFTSLGFGDLTPIGPVRLLVGVEALNGLLLIGWSASFTYLAMERFWGAQAQREDLARKRE